MPDTKTKRGRPPTVLIPGQPSPDGRWICRRPDPSNPMKFVCSCVKCKTEKQIDRAQLQAARPSRCFTCSPRGFADEARAKRIERLLRAGKLQTEIAAREGISPQRVGQIRVKIGIPGPRSGGKPSKSTRA